MKELVCVICLLKKAVKHKNKCSSRSIKELQKCKKKANHTKFNTLPIFVVDMHLTEKDFREMIHLYGYQLFAVGNSFKLSQCTITLNTQISKAVMATAFDSV